MHSHMYMYIDVYMYCIKRYTCMSLCTEQFTIYIILHAVYYVLYAMCYVLCVPYCLSCIN